MALADIYVLEDKQLWNGSEPLLNTYTYMRLAPEGTAANLVDAFKQEMFAELLAVQSVLVTHPVTRAYSLGNPADFAEESQVSAGTETADPLPPFNAINFTLRPSTRAIRPGSKRICGIPETAQLSGIITLAGYISELEALRLEMGSIIKNAPSEPEYQPVIVKRIPYVTERGNTAYRFPETDAELEFTVVSGVLVNLKISHQVSRGNAR